MEQWIKEQYVYCDDKDHLLLQDPSGKRSGQLALTMLAVDEYGRETVTANISREDLLRNFHKKFPFAQGLIAFAHESLGLSNLNSIVYDEEDDPGKSLIDDLKDGPVLVCRMDDSLECHEWVLITPLTDGEFLVREPRLGQARCMNATELKTAYSMGDAEAITVIRKVRKRRLFNEVPNPAETS